MRTEKKNLSEELIIKKVVSLITLSIIICACSVNNKNLPDGIEVIPVEIDEVSQDVSSFLEKIEIVPLETNDSSLFYRCNTIKVRISLLFIRVIKSFIRFRGMGNI